MAEFVKDLNLGWQLASGVTQVDQRSGSVHFDERMVNQGSGIILNASGANCLFYQCDGSFPMADVYELDVLASGTMRIQTPYSHQLGDVWVLNAAGEEVISHQRSKYTQRDNSSTTGTLNGAGTHYLYIGLRGRR